MRHASPSAAVGFSDLDSGPVRRDLAPDLRWCVIGNPESRRVAGFREAVAALGAGEVSTLSYLDLETAAATDALAPGTVVRIESPGESVPIAKALLRAGIEPLAELGAVPIDPEAIERIVWGRGEIHHPRQWYLGFRELLHGLERRYVNQPLHWTSTPATIITAFDKLACLKLWESGGLPVPRRWDGIQSYHELRKTIADRHARIFIKLRYGYSAMGAVALEWRGADVRAITTVETTWAEGRPRLFTTKRPRVLRREFEIAWLIDTLALEEIVVEEWLPKARWCGTPFDLRIVTIGGAAQHVVGRCSTSPFTNLNLDAARLAREDAAARLGETWPEALHLAERASKALDGAFMLGIDLLVRPCRQRFALLEANAFGDNLPRLQYEGQSTYEAQIAAFCEHLAVAGGGSP